MCGSDFETIAINFSWEPKAHNVADMLAELSAQQAKKLWKVAHELASAPREEHDRDQATATLGSECQWIEADLATVIGEAQLGSTQEAQVVEMVDWSTENNVGQVVIANHG